MIIRSNHYFPPVQIVMIEGKVVKLSGNSTIQIILSLLSDFYSVNVCCVSQFYHKELLAQYFH